MAVKFELNGKQTTVDGSSETPLLWVLRDELELTGTKYGCGRGVCGACTVLVDGESRRSCRAKLSSVEGKSVMTIEGLSPDGTHPLQLAWVRHQAPQCGYCHSGQILHAASLLRDNPSPSRDEIVEHMSRILCRCGAYGPILAAVEAAAGGET